MSSPEDFIRQVKSLIPYIIGSEDNPVNLIYFGVIAVGLTGAFIARFHTRGMTFAMLAMTLEACVAGGTLISRVQRSPVRSVTKIETVNGFFIALFALSALLFRYAAERIERPRIRIKGRFYLF